MARFPLTSEQQAAVDSRGGSLLVSAAAGSGKTRVLVERLLGRVEQEGFGVDRFLVITYTKAAAGELRGRVAKELSARIQDDPLNLFLRHQSTLLHAAQISTIHAYCAKLLRENAHVVELDPDFRQLEETDAQILQQNTMDEVLEQRYAQIEEYPGFDLLSETMGLGYDDKRLVQMALDIYRRIQSHPDPEGWLEQQRRQFSLGEITDIGQTPWAQVILPRARSLVEAAVQFTTSAIDRAEQDDQLADKCGSRLWDGLHLLEDILALPEGDWDGMRTAVKGFAFPRFGVIKDADDPAGKAQVTALRDLAKDQIKKTAAMLADDSASSLAALRITAPAIVALFDLISDFSVAFAAAKRKQGCVDFGDLEHFALQLLIDAQGAPTPLAQRESGRLVEVMVDEYQDTNAVQNAIFDAISGGGERLFMVGDVKQSIYRFRLAEPGIFLGKSKAFPLYNGDGQTGSRKVVLGQNFRSRREVLDAANQVFAAIMSTECGGLEYDQEAWLNEGACHSARDDCQTEFIILDSKRDEDAEQDGQRASASLLEARLVAQQIEELVNHKTLTGEADKTRLLRYDDIAILRHSLRSTMGDITFALEERDIPWLMDGGEEFFGATEVEIAICLLQVIDNPHQDIPLISVLRSPLYGFSADQLALVRAGCQGVDFYDALIAAAQLGNERCKTVRSDIEQLRAQAAQSGVHAFLWKLYDRTNMLGIFGAMPAGEARQNHLLALAEAARAFEGNAYRGLFAFLSYLETLRERGESLSSAPSRGSGGVQIKTIHKSKGLEFPVVFLMGMGSKINLADARAPILFHPKLGVGPNGFDPQRRLRYPTIAREAVRQTLNQETKSEAMRLLYVGMTRAVEKLIMTCVMKDAPATLGKLALETTNPIAPQAIESKERTGYWVAMAALLRPEAEHLRALADIQVPVDHSLTGEHWKIQVLHAESFERAPEQISSPYIQEAQDDISSETLLAQYVWKYPYANSDIPSKLTATGLKGRFQDQEAQEDAPAAYTREMIFDPPAFLAGERPLTAAQRGTALHLAMQFFDYRQTDSLSAIEVELRRLKELEILTPQQVDGISPQRILDIFQSALGKELRHNPTLRREFKFSVLVPAADYYDGVDEQERVLLQGVIDAFYETPQGLVVVDFKTDRVTEDTVTARAEDYRPQLDAYTRALAEITGKPVAQRVLWFFSLNRPFSL